LSKPDSSAAERPGRADVSIKVRQVEVGDAAAGQRIDNFLLAQLKGVPKSLVYRILRRGEVRVNKGRVKPSYRVAAGDQVRLPPLRLGLEKVPPRPSKALAAQLDQAVLYEDELVLVLNKPAGLAVHGGSGISLGVIETLRALRPGAELELVHRLDRDTSGCLLVSKRRSALRRLHAQLREGTVDKRYLVLLAGRLSRPVVEVAAPLRKNLLQGGERMVQVDLAEGKPARTVFRSRRRLGALTLAEVQLDTGRTHQIRVHAAHLGAPVAGDDKYGDASVNARLRALGLKRLFLHAAALSFRPRDGEPPIRVEAPLPEALDNVLKTLEEQPWTSI
jgi:23S rRNA pseudouridine955/2504/2580 synthase